MTKVTKLPTLLSYKDGTLVPGRGEGGWCVYDFRNAKEAAAFFSTYRFAAMPCWKRMEVVNGELCLVR